MLPENRESIDNCKAKANDGRRQTAIDFSVACMHVVLACHRHSTEMRLLHSMPYQTIEDKLTTHRCVVFSAAISPSSHRNRCQNVPASSTAIVSKAMR